MKGKLIIMNNELNIIKNFMSTLYRRCSRFHKTGCACDNLCGMADFCNHAFRLSEKEIDSLYKIYLLDDSEYAEELELAKKIKECGIVYKKLEQIINVIKQQ